MATTYTENLQLGIQEGTDYLDYALIAENFRKIDAAYGALLEQAGADNSEPTEE